MSWNKRLWEVNVPISEYDVTHEFHDLAYHKGREFSWTFSTEPSEHGTTFDIKINFINEEDYYDRET